MPKTDIKLYSKNTSGQKQTTTITYVNNEVSSDILKDFAQSLNALTTNSYEKTDRINTINCDTEQTKMFRNMKFEGVSRGATAKLTYNATTSASPAMIFDNNNSTTVRWITGTLTIEGGIATYTFTVPNEAGYIYAGLNERDDFYSAFNNAQVQ